MGKYGKRAGVLAFWLVIWQLAVMCIDNPLVLVGPLETAAAFVAQIGERAFWQTVAGSTGRIACGFLLAFFAGILAGSVASRFSFMRELFEPIVALMRAVPVAALVILVLILVGVEGLTLTISFLVVFPIIYQATLTGYAAADRELIEMAQVFRLPAWKRLLYVYRPALWPALTGGCKTALGMSWKSGVAAEVIGTPDFSIGAELYMAKIYFDTAELFAWTLVIILLSLCFERVFLWIMKWLGQPFGGLLLRHRGDEVGAYGAAAVELDDVDKSFGEQLVLRNLSLTFEPGGVYGLTAPSGGGKSTVFKLLMGLLQPDAGQIIGVGSDRVSAVFQEDRLCPNLTAQENACLAGGEPDLPRILPTEALHKKVSELSGGMKRRVAVARAMAAPGNMVLLDEPFAGLDEATKSQVMAYILEKRGGRTLIFTTHVPDDMKNMQALHVELTAKSFITCD